jgi:L-rhamnose isomerase
LTRWNASCSASAQKVTSSARTNSIWATPSKIRFCSASTLVRGRYLERVHIGLDFFDASINRVAAWTIGSRNALRALLLALLEPIEQLRTLEQNGDYTARLALLEELKTLPFGAVWDYHCLQQNVPVGIAYLDEVRGYEETVLANR